MSNRRIRSLSFNISNPDEKELYDFLETRKNISAYIKELIKNDLLRRYAEKIRKQERLAAPVVSEDVKAPVKKEKTRPEVVTRTYKGNGKPKKFF